MSGHTVREPNRSSWSHKTRAARKSLCVDYHGVLCSYTSGRHWEAGTPADDPPTEGAIAWLLAAASRYRVFVTSGRFAGDPMSVRQVAGWLIRHGVPPAMILETNPPWEDDGDWIVLTASRPRAWMTIDDRAYAFRGIFPELGEIDNFRPWNR